MGANGAAMPPPHANRIGGERAHATASPAARAYLSSAAVAAFRDSSTRARRLLPAVAALALLAFASPAAANEVVRDCAGDGELSGDYSNDELKGALRKIPADVDEYSDCRAVIAGAINAAPGSSRQNTDGGDATGGGASFRRDQEREAAPREGSKPAGKRRGRYRRTSGLGATNNDSDGPKAFNAGHAATGLPTPILLALAAFVLICAAGGALAVRRKGAPGSFAWCDDEKVAGHSDEAAIASALGVDDNGAGRPARSAQPTDATATRPKSGSPAP